jgi:riboflavin kinase/FMN adenylyltransferase
VTPQEVERLVEDGDLAAAARTLGRPYAVEGTVVHGDHRGHDLGFPTANLELEPGQPLPPKGIYVGEALGHRAAISIGVNPHYGGETLRVEAHLLDFEGDLYGRRLTLELWERLRDERAFGGEDELVAAIAADVEAARRAVRP